MHTPSSIVSDADEPAITIPVMGMSCAACQAHVTRVLQETPGVRKAEVNLLTHSASIRFDATVATPEKLVEAVRGSGYESSLPEVDGEAGLHELATGGASRWRALLLLLMAVASMLMSMPLMKAMPGRTGLWSWFNGWMGREDFGLSPLELEYSLLIMTLAGMLLAAGEVYRPAWKALLHCTSNMNTLVALGTLSALLYSAAATIVPGWFERSGLEPVVYYESVLFILSFLLLGRWLEARAKDRTLASLEAFARLQPQTARVRRDDRVAVLPITEINVGETLLLYPGDRVPLDGTILEGTSSIDESLLTGEALPLVRRPGDRLIGGSLNFDGSLTYRVTSASNGGVLGQMLRLLREAQASRAPTQQLAERVSAIFVPVVLGIAVLTFAAWVLFTHGHLSQALIAAVSVLVIACPCAMGLAVPAALTVATGRASEMGILIKSGEALERLASIDTVVLDKTGTLTAGKPTVAGIYPAPGQNAEELLRLTASLEERSEHPLAHAVVEFAKASGARLSSASAVKASPGKGVEGVVEGRAVAAGNTAMLEELGVAVPEGVGGASRSTLLVAVDRCYWGHLEVHDEIRPGAGAAVAALQSRGTRVIMLTGDNDATAREVASQTGIVEVYSALLPEEKVAHIRRLQQSGAKVAMVGDGLNDAAALAQADAGLAIGSGTDLTKESGDAILLSGNPQSIVAALALAKATLSTMRTNLGWAIGYNVVGIPIAAGVLYPLLGILLSPVIASAAMALSSVSVLANSLRLRRFEVR